MRIAVAATLAALLSTPAAPSLAASEKAGAAAAPAAIHLVFKLDPRLAGRTYGGERWVSPSTYSGAAGQDKVEARASAVDARRRPVKAGIEWSPSDPEMVAVTPPRGEQVKIAVKRPGESTLTVKSGEVSRRLIIKAAQMKGVWQVTISQ
jgi:hypothetical protein